MTEAHALTPLIEILIVPALFVLVYASARLLEELLR